jgi:glucose-6-phosphate isomerase
MEGEGMLILMNEDRTHTWAEKMEPGSVHYINGFTAHRTANTGSGILSFGACWPSDAGHDYDTISEHGFSKILVDGGGVPTLVDRAGIV